MSLTDLQLGIAKVVALFLILSATVLGSWTLGYKAGVNHEQAKQLEAALEQEKKAKEKLQVEIDRQVQLARQIAEQHTKALTITASIPTYVPIEVDRDCDPSIDVVRLRNAAASLEPADAAFSLDGAGAASSGIGFRAFLAADIDTIGRYNELMLRHNGLIDWICNHYELTDDYRRRFCTALE